MSKNKEDMAEEFRTRTGVGFGTIRLNNEIRDEILSNRLPRLLNSCYRFDVAQTIRKEHGRLFIPLSPDYTAAFLFLAYTDSMVYLDRPLFMCHGNKSNGQKNVMYGVEGYTSTLGDIDIYARTPLPINTTIRSGRRI